MDIRQSDLIRQRLMAVMAERDAPAVLLYATGARNVTVFGLMGPFRFALFMATGELTLWEFAGCGHLAAKA